LVSTYSKLTNKELGCVTPRRRKRRAKKGLEKDREWIKNYGDWELEAVSSVNKPVYIVM
jgi:hypothetical protein